LPGERQQLCLVRHGETAWSKTGQHTGRVDIPLTEVGRDAALRVGRRLQGSHFAAVFASPLTRALETARISGWGERIVIDDDLVEWNYGRFEGRTTAEIRSEVPDWSLWRDGCPQGERASEVGARAERFLERARKIDGDVLVFAHGHLLRVLAACWLALGPEEGRAFALSTGALCRLGYERENAVLLGWNDVSHLEPARDAHA